MSETVRNVIGFDTPSKAKAQEELNNQSNGNNLLNDVSGMSTAVKIETCQRLEQLGGVICGNDFASLPPQQRQQLLLDFTYYSKVVDNII